MLELDGVDSVDEISFLRTAPTTLPPVVQDLLQFLYSKCLQVHSIQVNLLLCRTEEKREDQPWDLTCYWKIAKAPSQTTSLLGAELAMKLDVQTTHYTNWKFQYKTPAH